MENRLTEADGLELVRVFNALMDLVPRTRFTLTLHMQYRAGEGWRVRFSNGDDGGAANRQPDVPKAEAGRTLVDAVRALLQHREFFTEWVPATGARQSVSSARASGRGSSHLTPRQREILQLLAEGKSNKQIGAELGITTKTAETHRSNIMAKLNLHSMSELVRYAIRNRVIEP